MNRLRSNTFTAWILNVCVYIGEVDPPNELRPPNDFTFLHWKHIALSCYLKPEKLHKSTASLRHGHLTYTRANKKTQNKIVVVHENVSARCKQKKISNPQRRRAKPLKTDLPRSVLMLQYFYDLFSSYAIYISSIYPVFVWMNSQWIDPLYVYTQFTFHITEKKKIEYMSVSTNPRIKSVLFKWMCRICICLTPQTFSKFVYKLNVLKTIHQQHHNNDLSMLFV